MTDRAPSPQPDLQTTLDFINTAELERGRPADAFESTRSALDWLQGRVGIDASGVPESAAVLTRVVRARTAFRELWDAVIEGRAADGTALDEMNRVLRHRSLLELRVSRRGGGGGGAPPPRRPPAGPRRG